MAELSVVLISKNQAFNIARLIESVLRETAALPGTEIVLVDSASADGTVQRACAFPIDVLRLRPGQVLTAAAGRYIGTRHTTGKLVLFLDGDMELCSGWLARAQRMLRADPRVAAITGQVHDVPPDAPAAARPPLPDIGGERAVEVAHGGGAALYRRAVLDKIGTFNPYFYSDEEPELCLRIRRAGYRVRQLDYPIAYHYSQPSLAPATVIRRRGRNLFLGPGQILRYHAGTDLFWAYARERGFSFVPGLGLLAGLGSLGWSLQSRRWRPFGAWLLLLGAVIAADIGRKRSVEQTVFSLLQRLCIVEGTLRGLALPVGDPAGYPGKLDVMKRVELESGAARFAALEVAQ